MKKSRRLLTVILLLAALLPAAAQTCINPGLKLGYRFGDAGGFVAGFEVSIMVAHENRYVGFVVAADGTPKIWDCHFGVEYGVGYVGICAGPVVAHRSDTTAYGFRVTPYAGIFLVPYYNYQFLFQSGGEHEIGSYIKLSIPNSSWQTGRLGG
ncbi:MAG: hypothetical protein NTZ35_17400 [Ignavibacteriales bacterium]|nr:hypothetical protein [Ignavibacteriales bacterium]